MKIKKDFKYYVRFYLIVLAAYAILVLISTAMNDWLFNIPQILSILYLPLLFVSFIYLFDTGFGKFTKTRTKEEQNEMNTFVTNVVKKIEEKEEFTIEDYKRLRESDKFQKALKHSYEIYKDGETETMNITFLKKKFKNDSLEGKAMKVVLEELESHINS
jgi:hypothetical protein